MEHLISHLRPIKTLKAKGALLSVVTAVAVVVSLLSPLSAAAQTVSGPALPSGSGKDYLRSGEILRVGDYLSSDNGRYELRMQGDGNLVLYVAWGNKAIWASNTMNSGADYVGNQGDGNLVLYDTNPLRPRWATNTAGRGPSVLYLQNDGNLVLRAAGNVPTWASGTNINLPRLYCDPVSPIFYGSSFNIPTPYHPSFDGLWLHGLVRVSAWTAPCGSVLKGVIERKVCDWNGCSWHERVVTPWKEVNQKGWTFMEVHSICEKGTHRYRVRADVKYPVISDEGTTKTRQVWSNSIEYTCYR
jgi:hypothetical protein